MLPPIRLTLTGALALLVAHTIAVSQRSSPQFSFPSSNGDLFSSGNPDLSVSNIGQPQQQQPSSQSQSDSSSTLISQSIPQQQQQQQPQQQQQQQQQPSQRQSSRPSASNISGQTVGASSNQNGRQRASSSSSSSAQSSNQQSSSSSRHPANMHFQNHSPTTSVSHQRDQQAAIEAGRKADASAASLAASSGQAYQCPDLFGFFRHHKSCDKYWACENGTATLKLCGNGLNFDDSDARRENCAYPFSVDCGTDRVEVEPPISTPHCPRLYGLFPDTGNCRVFYSCWNGEASKYECPAGLAYDSEHRVCVWADHVDRCDQSEISDGFVCPDPTEADQPGHYTRHAHPTDCRKFYVCIEGVARPYGCSIGTVFNVDSLQCDEPENVSGCEKYYGDLDPKLAKKLARENVQQSSGSPPSRSNVNTNSAGSSSSGRTSSQSQSNQAS